MSEVSSKPHTALTWFGNLDIAVKYGLVVGTLLFLTLIAGVFKIIYDRRKMTKLLLEKGFVTPVNSDEAELTMREKDEGDLFGIRAIEAGYYGGVAQSAPSSAFTSPAGTPRTGSPASMFSKGSADSRAAKLHTSTYDNPNSQRLVAPIPRAPIALISPDGQSMAGLSTYFPSQPDTARKTAPQPIRIPSSQRLQPSDAELSGRLNHGKIGSEFPMSPLPFSPAHSSPISPLPSARPLARTGLKPTSSSTSSERSRRGSDSNTSAGSRTSDSSVSVHYEDKEGKVLPSEDPFSNSHSTAPKSTKTAKSTASSTTRETSSSAPSMPSAPARVASPSTRPANPAVQSARLISVKPAPDTAAPRHKARQSSCALPSLDQNPYAKAPASDIRPVSEANTESDEIEVKIMFNDEDAVADPDTVSPRSSFSFAPTASEYQRKVSIVDPGMQRTARQLGAGVPLSALKKSNLKPPRKIEGRHAAGVYQPSRA